MQLLNIRPGDMFIVSGREELGDGDTANSFPLHAKVAMYAFSNFVYVINSFACNFDS